MTDIVVKNGAIFTPGEIRCSNLWIKDGLIHSICDNPPESGFEAFSSVDASGHYVTPGLVDLQVNGTSNCNLWQLEDSNSIKKLSDEMANCGVTTFLPTLITDDIDRMVKTQEQLNEFGVGAEGQWLKDLDTARMPGLHLEGPFLSPERPGVHPKEFIVDARIDLLERLVGKSVLLMTLAGERDSNGEIIDWLKSKGINLSIGHSNANYLEASSCFDRGVNMVTHLFNAMSGIHHREPGLPGAALLNKDVSCCLIPDGLHLCKEVVELVYRIKGKNKTIIVTDIAHVGTNAGGLVGSSITLNQGVKNLCDWQICDFASAIKMATFNPARAIGLESKVGQIKPGLLADLVLWDKETLSVKEVFLAGQSFKSST